MGISMFEIVVGSDFFYGSTDSTYTCTFYCQTSDGAFPDCEWTDYAHTVLLWWSEAVAQAACTAGNSFKLLFEDGPYWIDVSKRGDFATLRFRTGKRVAPVLPDVCLHYRELAEALDQAMRRLSSALFLSGNPSAAQEMAEEAARLRKHAVLSETGKDEKR